MTYRLGTAAHRDISEAMAWLLERNPKAANETLVSLEKTFERLTEFPRLGRRVSLGRFEGRCIPCAGYKIFYRIDGDGVTIVRVLHDKRDEDRQL